VAHNLETLVAIGVRFFKRAHLPHIHRRRRQEKQLAVGSYRAGPLWEGGNRRDQEATQDIPRGRLEEGPTDTDEAF
jgi:hypothetical protein